MTATNRVYDTGSLAVYGIAFDKVKLVGVSAKVPFQVALFVSAETPNELKPSLEISDGNKQSGNGVDLYPARSDEFSGVFEEILNSPSTDTTATIDLRFLHGALQYPSEEEQAKEHFVLGGDHANELRHTYAAWVAEVLFKNCSFSADIEVDLTNCSVVGILTMQHRKTQHSYRFTFRASFTAGQEEWQEVLLQTVFGLQPATA